MMNPVRVSFTVVNKILKLDPLLDQRGCTMIQYRITTASWLFILHAVDASVFQFVGTIADGSISEKNVLVRVSRMYSTYSNRVCHSRNTLISARVWTTSRLPSSTHLHVFPYRTDKSRQGGRRG